MAGQKKLLYINGMFIFIILITCFLFVSCGSDSEKIIQPTVTSAEKSLNFNYFYSQNGTLVRSGENNYDVTFNNISDKTYYINQSSEGFEETARFFSEKYNSLYGNQNPEIIITILDSNDVPTDVHSLQISSLQYNPSVKSLTFNALWEGSSDDDISPSSGITFGHSLLILNTIPDEMNYITEKSSRTFDPNSIYNSNFSPSTLMIILQMSMVSQIDYQIKMQAEEVQNRNKQIAANNQRMADLRNLRQQLTSPSGICADPNQCNLIQTQMDNLKTVNDTLQNSNQMDMIRLQNYMNARNSCFDMVTNKLSKDQKTINDIVGNLR